MQKILLNLASFSLNFGNKILFESTSFRVLKGDKIGLIGLNGSGKSSLLKTISGKIPLEKDAILDKPKDGLPIQYVPQELHIPPNPITIKNYFYFFNEDLKPLHEELEKINQELEKFGTDELLNKQKDIMDKMESLDSWQRLSKFESYLKAFNILDINKSLKETSGGERKKVLLALGFSSSAELIMWDEPTNHLDMESISLFENELEQTQNTFILITHDRHLLSKVTSKIYVISQKKLSLFQGNYSDYLENLSLKEEERKKITTRLKNKLRREQDWMNQGIKARGTRSKKRVENFQDLKRNVEKLKAEEKSKLELKIHQSNKKSKKLLELENVGCKRGQTTIFSNLNLKVWQNDKIGLIGKNGQGKSSLLLLLNGSINPSEGNMRFPSELKIKYYDQNREELSDELDPFKYLGDGQDFVNLPNGSTEHIYSYAEKFRFSADDLRRPMKTFSGGERNRLQLAKHLADSADLWLFDEPTNDLDLETLEILEQTLSKFKGSVILVSHDRCFLENITNRTWSIHNGNVDNYEAGYADIGPFLELDKIEKELGIIEISPHKTDNFSQKSGRTKLTNKQKLRLKALPGEIEKLEKSLEKIQVEIEGYDFSAQTLQSQQNYENLCNRSENLENELLSLYEELEDLQ